MAEIRLARPDERVRWDALARRTTTWSSIAPVAACGRLTRPLAGARGSGACRPRDRGWKPANQFRHLAPLAQMLSRLSDDWQAHIGRCWPRPSDPFRGHQGGQPGRKFKWMASTQNHTVRTNSFIRFGAMRCAFCSPDQRSGNGRGRFRGKSPANSARFTLRKIFAARESANTPRRRSSASCLAGRIPVVAGARENQEKPPWKDTTPPQGVLETSFPALLGESVAPFRAPDPRRAVVPWNPERGDLMDAETAGLRGNARPAPRFLQAETLWEAHRHGQISYRDQAVRPVSVAPTRVAYTKAGTNLAAAVVQDEEAIADHKLYWEPADSLAEARYLSSTAPRCRPA